MPAAEEPNAPKKEEFNQQSQPGQGEKPLAAQQQKEERKRQADPQAQAGAAAANGAGAAASDAESLVLEFSGAANGLIAQWRKDNTLLDAELPADQQDAFVTTVAGRAQALFAKALKERRGQFDSDQKTGEATGRALSQAFFESLPEAVTQRLNVANQVWRLSEKVRAAWTSDQAGKAAPSQDQVREIVQSAQALLLAAKNEAGEQKEENTDLVEEREIRAAEAAFAEFKGRLPQEPEKAPAASAAAGKQVDALSEDERQRASEHVAAQIQREKALRAEFAAAKAALEAARGQPKEEEKAQVFVGVYRRAKAAGLVVKQKVDESKDDENASLPPRAPKSDTEKQGYLKKDHWKMGWRLLALLGGVLLGGAAVAFSYFIFPLAMAQVATVLGLAGPLALIVPLLAVGLIGALFGAALLAFLEARLAGVESKNYIFMRNLVIAFGLIGSIALGLFIVAATPAVFGLLNVAAAGTAVATSTAYASPFILGGLISLVVIGLVGYGLYRASGMRENQWHYNVKKVKVDLNANGALGPQAAPPHEPLLMAQPSANPASPSVFRVLDLLQQGLERGYSADKLLALFDPIAHLNPSEDRNALQSALGGMRDTKQPMSVSAARTNALDHVAQWKRDLFPADKSDYLRLLGGVETNPLKGGSLRSSAPNNTRGSVAPAADTHDPDNKGLRPPSRRRN